jgi:hypothetical protein
MRPGLPTKCQIEICYVPTPGDTYSTDKGVQAGPAINDNYHKKFCFANFKHIKTKNTVFLKIEFYI